MPNSVRFTASVEDKVSSQLGRIRDQFDLLGKGAASSTAVGVIGAKALGIGLGLVTQAIGGAVDFMGMAIKAANEEQASIAQLTTSLKANIPAWDGNTAAIEKVLTARMALGFSDDEQRNSLSLLVAATHDVNKALAVEATAMDLARFKHISLEEATGALTKVEAGSYRILKSLGIELKVGATQTEALAAVQRVAAGQAADYAATNEGKLLVSQIKINEAMEKFGKEIAPVQADAMVAVADGAGTLMDVLGALGKVTTPVFDAMGTGIDYVDRNIAVLILNIKDINDAIGGTPVPWHAASDAIVKVGQDADETAGHVRDASRVMADATKASSMDISNAYWAMVNKIQTQVARWQKIDADTRVKEIANARAIVDKAFGQLITGQDLVATNAEIMATRTIISSGKSSKAEIAAAKLKLVSLERDQANYLLELAAAGDTGSGIVKATVAQLLKELASAHGAERKAIQLEIEAWQKLAATIKATPTLSGTHPGGGGPQKYASGGYFPPGTSGTVGEAGIEGVTMLPGGGAIVFPHSGNSGSAPSGGQPVVIALQLDGYTLAKVVDEQLYYRRKSAPR